MSRTGGKLIILLLLSTYTINNYQLEAKIEGFFYSSLVNNALEDHAAIDINSDGDFVSLGLPGTGTKEDPYRIENYNITEEQSFSGISVSGTTKHFIIQNCYISSTLSGISLFSVEKGTCKIINNTSINNHYSGINILYSASGIELINNTCISNNFYGIEIASSDSVLLNNTCIQNKKEGIVLSSSIGTILTNNLCDDNDYNGILISECYRITLKNNSCINSYYNGIKLDNSDSSTLTGNTCSNNVGDGIYLFECSGVSIIDNLCYRNNYGVRICSSSSSNISQNTCSDNDRDGICLWDSSQSFCSYNLCSNNLYSGISLYIGTYSCTLNLNYLKDNADYGVYLGTNTEGNSIYHNIFQSNIGDNSQSYDNGVNNNWYTGYSKEGNYWSDWIGYRYYDIDGNANRTDPYPMVLNSTLDIDGDGMADNWETRVGLNPSINDSLSDADEDGLTNIEEYTLRTHPKREDTDEDGMPDGWEVQYTLNPCIDDSEDDADEDGLTNEEEYNLGTNPRNQDTDGDGWTDKEEADKENDPLDPEDYPVPYYYLTGILVLLGLAFLRRRKSRTP